jgi:CheY-like chemotaxis protein/HPt (histidine-containing phosphotransfer) domain-containing protein
MKSLGARACRKRLELACHIGSDVPQSVIGDRARLRQVIVNLVGNAIKFTDSGEVVVDVQRELATDGDVQLHFTVADTGIGIPKEKRADIFGVFEQVDSSMRRRHGGTGLGLAISSRLVRLMGGRIWVESEQGQGSRFHFTARFAVVSDETAIAKLAEPDVVHDMRVLVVDDNATNCRILEEMLSNWGMAPVVVTRPEEVLQRLGAARQAGTPFRLVLTDAHMPHIDGFSLAEQIKEKAEMGSTVIMMLTSGDRPGDISRCEQLGISAYLLKPIKQSELFNAILMALGITELEAGGEPETARRSSRHGRLRILLAEDSLVNQKLAVRLLEREGHEVLVAHNGKEAVAAARVGVFDLVLMDVQMPEMDGLEATAMIRALEKTSGGHLPIVAMTAHAMKGDREMCLEAGMDEYVAKPIRRKQFFETIDRVLDHFPPAAADAGPAPAGPPPAAAFDWKRTLQAMAHDPVTRDVLVDAVLEECPKMLERLNDAAARGDAHQLWREAHTLKGSVTYFGDNPVFQHAQHLETLGRAGDLTDVANTMRALEAATGRMVSALQACAAGGQRQGHPG